MRLRVVFTVVVAIAMTLPLLTLRAQDIGVGCGTEEWQITGARNGKFVRGETQALLTNTRFRWRPAVIRNDRTAPVLYEFRPASNLVFTSLVLVLNSGETFTLRDDGSGGDRARLDSIYTTQIPAALLTSKVSPSRPYRPFVGFLRVMNGSAMILQYNIIVEVWNPNLPTVTIKSLGTSAQASRHLVNLVVPVQSLNTLPNDDFRSVAQTFYRYYGDMFDFMNIIHLPSYFGNRYHGNISTTVQGIGIQTLSNNSSPYGSAGKLIGFNMYPISSFFDGASDAYTHELGHQWINYLSNSAFAAGIPHWPLSSIGRGIMGISIGGTGGAGGNFAYNIVSNGVGGYQFQTASGLKVFNSWELYMMGLMPPDSVSPALVLANQNQTPADNALVQGSVNQVSMSSIIQQFGVRIPNFANSPKSYRIASIIVSDTLLTQEEMALYDFFSSRAGLKQMVNVEEGLINFMGAPFFVATGGRAELNPVVDPSLAVSVSTSVQDASPEVFQARLFPQPAANQTTLEYTLPELSEVRVNVVNMLGMNVLSYALGKQQSGSQRFVLNTDGLNTGAYFVRLSSGTTTAVLPMQVAR